MWSPLALIPWLHPSGSRDFLGWSRYARSSLPGADAKQATMMEMKIRAPSSPKDSLIPGVANFNVMKCRVMP